MPRPPRSGRNAARYPGRPARRGGRRGSRPLYVVLYAAFLGILLASYIAPLQEIAHGRAEIPALEEDLRTLREDNAHREQLVEDLQTSEGVERAARERYGMVRPGEEVYLVPENGTGAGD